jgi:hypothetical protein
VDGDQRERERGMRCNIGRIQTPVHTYVRLQWVLCLIGTYAVLIRLPILKPTQSWKDGYSACNLFIVRFGIGECIRHPSTVHQKTSEFSPQSILTAGNFRKTTRVRVMHPRTIPIIVWYSTQRVSILSFLCLYSTSFQTRFKNQKPLMPRTPPLLD